MKTEVLENQKEKKSEALLPKEIFGLEMNEDLVHQVACVQMANQRQVLANVKDRGEVRGGGRKPWRQKGTGRARHGSRRSPIWKGGGVTFGPTKNRNFSRKINRKMRRKAVFMVLSAKAKSNLIFLLDDLVLKSPKTKEINGIFSKLKMKGSFLLVLPKLDKGIFLAARNIKGIGVIEARNLNVLELLSFRNLVMPKESIKVIKETFLK